MVVTVISNHPLKMSHFHFDAQELPYLVNCHPVEITKSSLSRSNIAHPVDQGGLRPPIFLGKLCPRPCQCPRFSYQMCTLGVWGARNCGHLQIVYPKSYGFKYVLLPTMIVAFERLWRYTIAAGRHHDLPSGLPQTSSKCRLLDGCSTSCMVSQKSFEAQHGKMDSTS